ncbi:MAG: conjugal transfer protein TraW [Patescibacteria group bacterium]|nr:conjugal transfer protein TraW [Patescibacteria group bacterium]
MRAQRKIVAAALTCAALLMSPSSAWALGDSFWVQLLNAVINQYMWTQNLVGTTDAASIKNGQVVSEATTQATNRQIEMANQREANDVARRLRPPIDPCANAAAGAYPDPRRRTPVDMPARFGGGAGRPGMIKSSGSAKLDQAISIANGQSPAPPPEIQAQISAEGQCQAYAAGNRAASCKAAGLATGAAPLPNADVNAASVFSGAQSATAQGADSSNFSADQLVAAQAYLRNIYSPLKLRDLTDSELKSAEGRRYLSLRDSYEAKMDLAQYPAVQHTNDRRPNRDTIAVLRMMLDGGGSASNYLKQHLAQINPNWSTEGVSNSAMTDIEVLRRYHNPDWIKEIAATPDSTTLMREQLMVQAQTNYLLRELLRRGDETPVLLGALYGSSVNREFVPELRAQHAKAVSGSAR